MQYTLMKHEDHQKPYLDSSMRLRIMKGYTDFLSSQDFDWSLTANFNRETSKDQGYKKLKEWHSRIDNKIYGRNYHKKDRLERTYFVAIPEIGGYSGHLHYHVLAKMPSWAEKKFTSVSEPIWRELVKCGSLDIQKIGDTGADNSRVIGYDLKDIWKNRNFEDIIISTQFSGLH